MRSGVDWGVCGTRRLRNSHQFLNYVISGLFDRRQSAPILSTENGFNNITSNTQRQSKKSTKDSNAVCHNNGHYQSRQVVSICIPFAKYWTLSIK
jgi:hypothetical protein